MPDYIPISVAYKKKTGQKVWVQTFTDQRCPDTIISSRSKLLPEGSEIVDLGVGSKFEKLYKQKYA
jgi:hypothetical protein